jgi:hypothetical protein
MFEFGIRIAVRPGLWLAAYALENATSWIPSTALSAMLYDLKLLTLILQTSWPERIRNLANGNLQSGYKNFIVKPFF